MESADCLVARAAQVKERFLADFRLLILTFLSLERARLQRVGLALPARQSWMVVTARVRLARSSLEGC